MSHPEKSPISADQSALSLPSSSLFRSFDPASLSEHLAALIVKSQLSYERRQALSSPNLMMLQVMSELVLPNELRDLQKLQSHLTDQTLQASRVLPSHGVSNDTTTQYLAFNKQGTGTVWQGSWAELPSQFIDTNSGQSFDFDRAILFKLTTR